MSPRSRAHTHTYVYMPLSVVASDVGRRARLWRLVDEEGRCVRCWTTARHTPPAHPLLSWRNAAHMSLETSLLAPAAELGGLARAILGRKPFARESLTDGPGAAREAASLARRARELARSRSADAAVRVTWSRGGGGAATGGGAHWSVCASLRGLTWGDAFDLDSIEASWRALMVPLLSRRGERGRLEEVLAAVRRRWHAPRDAAPALAGDSLCRHGMRGPAPLPRTLPTALFGGREAISPRAFDARLGRACPSFPRRAVASLRRHLLARGRRRPWPPSAARLLPRPRPRSKGGRPVRRRCVEAWLAAARRSAARQRRAGAWDCYNPRTGSELLLNGLLLGYALPSTAGALLLLLTQTELPLRGAAAAARAEGLINRPFTAAAWAKLQPGRAWPAELEGQWTVARVSREGLVLVPSELFSMDDGQRDEAQERRADTLEW